MRHGVILFLAAVLTGPAWGGGISLPLNATISCVVTRGGVVVDNNCKSTPGLVMFLADQSLGIHVGWGPNTLSAEFGVGYSMTLV
jgi:hypothetical protein